MTYTWQITLADSSVKNQDVDPFQLAWEANGAVKTVAIIDGKTYSADLTTGQFSMDGTIVTVPGTPSGAKSMYYRKRNQVRSDGTQILSSRYFHIFGFKASDGNLYLAEVHPALEQVPEQIVQPYKK